MLHTEELTITIFTDSKQYARPSTKWRKKQWKIHTEF